MIKRVKFATAFPNYPENWLIIYVTAPLSKIDSVQRYRISVNTIPIDRSPYFTTLYYFIAHPFSLTPSPINRVGKIRWMKNRGNTRSSGIGFRVLTADRRSVAIFSFPRLYPSSLFSLFFFTPASPGLNFRKSNKKGCARRQGCAVPSSGLFEFVERVRFCLFSGSKGGRWRACTRVLRVEGYAHTWIGRGRGRYYRARALSSPFVKSLRASHVKSQRIGGRRRRNPSGVNSGIAGDK